MNVQDKSFLVVGVGKSGIAAATLLKEKHCKVSVYDGNKDLNEAGILKEHEELKGVSMCFGTLTEELKKETDIVVLSPGVPTDLPFVQELANAGKLIWGEIELAYTFSKGDVVAITGTNGKTTTTTLVGEIMQEAYGNTDVVGNIGNPYTLEVTHQTDASVTVAEISSFQLETTQEFHPLVSAILNITPDHLNRHHTMENYIKAKEDITKKQTKEDVCVLNYDNEYTGEFAKRCPANVVLFSSREKLEDGFYYEDGTIYRAGVRKEGTGKKGATFVSYNQDKDSVKEIMKTNEMNLVGLCNIENVMAALAIAESMNVPLDTTLKVIKSFKAVEHRIEFVATKHGVDYYNDSKGTNPDAAIQGIKAMTKPTILIGGGYDKGSEYDEWIESFDNKVKLLVLIGATKEKIAKCAKEHGINQVVLTDTFEDAMDICIKEAKEGDAVLLSPACASWGMFTSYEERGKLFKKIVNAI
ncbi:MAG: UDP-N-acetylmuramoyl-L-alanine--D-glutamate ligase [Lachnospiraceae bacterium]|nr:UDP-N-acetylmuramoyl-L-alanine--D-glutamate ligase [Lachnospiraceae bacterium]